MIGSGFPKLLGKCKFIDKNHEIELFRLWREEGDTEAKEQLFRSCAPFALRMALCFCEQRGRLRDLEEFESLALEGLYKAMLKWDASFGYRLSTYARAWCFQCMRRGLIEDRIIPIPNYLVTGKNIKKKYKDKAATAMKIGRLEIDLTIDDPIDDVSEDEEQKKHLQILYELIKLLNERERSILKKRVFENKSLRVVGKELGLTPERIRQIQVKTYDKLRKGFKNAKS